MAISNPVSLGATNNSAAATTIALTTGATVPAGGKIFLAVGNETTNTVSGVSGGGLTWTKDQEGLNGVVGLAIFSADAPAGLASGTVITATYNASSQFRFIAGAYSTGVATGSGAAYGAVAQNQSVFGWSTTTTLVNAGDILFSASVLDSSTGATSEAPSGGNTEITDDSQSNGDGMTTQYQIGTGASIAGQGTWTSGGTGPTVRSAGVAYKAAAGGTALPTRPANPYVGPMALRHISRTRPRWFPGAPTPTSTVQALAAAIAGQSAISASLTVQKALAATVAGQSSITAGLTDRKALAALIAGQSGVTAGLTDRKALIALITGQSSIVAGITDKKALAALIAAQSVITAAFVTPALLTATIAGQSSIAAALRVAKAAQASIVAGSTVTATLKVVRTLAAQVSGVSVVSGTLTDKKLLAAVVGGQSQVLASLSAGGATVVVTSRDGQNAVIYVVTNQ